MTYTTHAHITAWVLTLVLFIVAYALTKSGRAKAAKIVHMILRLFYLLTLATGGALVHTLFTVSPVEYILKSLVGLWVLGAMEMVLVRTKKDKNTKGAWIQLVVAVIIVLYLGLKLPLGFQIF
ncbi:YisL family protein [Cytobacillus sp. FJAT-54145]|uniref:UPF0344 protein ACFYKX_06810 n=1 Tax=Cytobacillus spartinae TaxID=3299023 RepID=A0ABW6K7Y1_9BACI